MKYGVSISLRRVRDDGDPQRLHRDVWRLFETSIREHCVAKPYVQVLAEYLGSCPDDGQASADQLTYVFSDAAGLCEMSAVAAFHWVELLRSALAGEIAALASRHGFALTETWPPVDDLLERGPEYPLVERGKILCAVAANDGQGELFSDEGCRVPSRRSLREAERRWIDELARTRRCGCQLCVALRLGQLPRRAQPALSEGLQRCEGLAAAMAAPASVGELAIADVPMASLPEEIGALCHLTRLGVFGCELTRVPDSIGQLQELKRLDLHWNQLASLPGSLGDCEALEELDVSHNQLTSLPVSLGRLRRLAVLQLAQNPLAELPGELAGLTALEELGLGGNPFARFPPEILALGLLKKLTVEGLCCGLPVPPVERWPALTRLRLIGAGVQALPAAIGGLSRLVSLVLSDNQLTELPDELGRLSRLAQLAVDGNGLRRFPAVLPRLRLIELSLGRTQLEALPDDFGQLRELRHLNLRENPLTALPESLADCALLETLVLEGCPIRALPFDLRALPRLEGLNLGGTALIELPAGLTSLRNLRWVRLPAALEGEAPALRKQLRRASVLFS